MKYTAITKKSLKVNTRTIPAGTHLEVVGRHNNTVSCIWNGSKCGMFTVLRTAVDIEYNKPSYEIGFNVTGYMRITVEMNEPKEGSDVMWTADADAIQDALETGKLAISATEDGEAILTADGTVVGRTCQIKDQTSWEDFTVEEAS